MSETDSIIEELEKEPIPPLLKDDGQPIFKDSWEAEAFAIGNILMKQGFLTCAQWVEIFSQEIKEAQAKGDPDRGDTYYQHWLNTLERLCIERGLIDWESHKYQLKLWHQAVKNTPHGVPLTLENAFLSDHLDEDDHHHHHSHNTKGDRTLDNLPENMWKPVAVVKLKAN